MGLLVTVAVPVPVLPTVSVRAFRLKTAMTAIACDGLMLQVFPTITPPRAAQLPHPANVDPGDGRADRMMLLPPPTLVVHVDVPVWATPLTMTQLSAKPVTDPLPLPDP
jgi:hypothetical protein